MTSSLLAAASPLDHVVQWTYETVKVCESDHGVFGGAIQFTPGGEITVLSNHIIMQVMGAVLLVLFIPMFSRKRRTGDAVADLTPRGFGNFIETICAYLRDTIVKPALHEHTDRFTPYIWSVFFYILLVNLLGLLPLEPLTRGLVKSLFPGAHHGIGGSATGNIWVCSTLAGCTLFMIVGNGFRYNGVAYIKHFFQGPVYIAPLIALLEVVGIFAKCFALTVRLFANMVAGHVLLAVLAGFISASIALGVAAASGIGITVVIVSVAFNLLEIFVAFLQAFIFAFLTTLFIGQAVVIHHEEHGHEEHAVAH